jgi:replicative DNA helicase
VSVPGGGHADLDRTPPQDMVAEQCALGGMLLSKDAIADVIEVLRTNDFYRPAHGTIFDSIIDLYGKGEPADPVTVAAELTRAGALERIGGAPYIHTLIASVPTAANAGYYAEIVRERAILRRLIEAGTRVVQMGYGASADNGGDIDNVVDRAQAELYNVVERRATDDFVGLGDIMMDTFAELEAIQSHQGGLNGVPTGFKDLDGLTNGLHPGQLVVIAGRPGLGKALALETKLATPSGWTTMGAVRVGDRLLGADGRPTKVVAATEVMTGRPCYEVRFDDGSVIVADAEHQWLTQTRKSRRAAQETGRPAAAGSQVRTTRELAQTVNCRSADARLNHSIAVTEPLDLPSVRLLVDPYVLGVWLGAGHSAAARFTTADPEIAMYVEDAGYRVVPGSAPLLYSIHLHDLNEIEDRECVVCGQTCRNARGTVQAQLRTIGVLNNRHIPTDYLRGSEVQRRQLLAGLLDTDGTVMGGGSVQFTSTNQRLAADVRELIVSLGYRCGMTTKRVTGCTEGSSIAFTITFSTEDDVFALERKRLAHKERRRSTAPRSRTRFVTEVRAIESVPVRCVEVDNADHLYLAGESMIPTHNSTIGLDIMRSASLKHGMASVLFSLEMGRSEITMRLLAAEAGVQLKNMRNGQMNDNDWNKLARRMGEVASAPLFIDDSANLTMMEIRAKARRLKQRHDLKLIVLDYLQLMSSPRKVENRQQEVAEMSRNLKLLAKDLQVPVIAISQLNRGAEQRADKKPQLSDLRESGAIEQDADIVVLLHREDAYDRESPRAGEADLIVAKNRNGPTMDLVVASQLHYSRFADMAR